MKTIFIENVEMSQMTYSFKSAKYLQFSRQTTCSIMKKAAETKTKKMVKRKRIWDIIADLKDSIENMAYIGEMMHKV